MSGNVFDMRDWMREVERQLKQAAKAKSTSQINQLRQDVTDAIENIEAGGGDERTPAAPVEIVAQSELYVNTNGHVRGRVTIDFPAVTRATDATPLEVSHYKLWGRDETGVASEDLDDLIWRRVQDSSRPGFMVQDLEPGSVWRYRIQAIGRTTVRPGAWSQEIYLLIGTDTTPPPIPPAPVVSTFLAMHIVEWDGLAANGAAMPTDFSHIEIGVGPLPDEVEPERIIRAASREVFSGAGYGVPVFYRFRSVDFSGNASSWSQASTLTSQPLVTSDISGLDTTIEDQNQRTEEAEQAARDAIAQAEQAANEAAQAQEAANQAQEEAAEAYARAAEAEAMAAQEAAEAAQARADAQRALAQAAEAQKRAEEARGSADIAFDAVESMLGIVGRVVHQEAEPTGADANPANLWIKDSTGEVYSYTSADGWTLITDPVWSAAALEADQAADDAAAKENLAATATATRVAAQDQVDALEAAAEAARTVMQAANATQVDALHARAAAFDEHATARRTLLDEVGVISLTEPQPDRRTDGMLWMDGDTPHVWNAGTETWDDPTGDLAALITDYTTKWAAWQQASQDFQDAQTAYSDAASDYWAARGDVRNASDALDNARAQESQAVTDAVTARTHANQLMHELQVFMGTSGRVIYQEDQPTDPQPNDLWIRPSDGSARVWDQAQNAWIEVQGEALSQLAQDVDAAKDAALASEQAAQTAQQEAEQAKLDAQEAANVASGLEAAATQAAQDAQAAQQEANLAKQAALDAQASADQALQDLIDAMGRSGKVIYQDEEPTGEDRNPNNLWIKDSTGEVFAFDTSQDAWVLVESDRIQQMAADADAAADRAEAAEQAAQAAQAEAVTAQQEALAAEQAAAAARDDANTAQQEAADARQGALDAQAAAEAAQTNAQNAFDEIQGIIADSGKVIHQEAEPTGEDRNPNNLWIKDSTGEPYVWDPDTETWVLVTDQRIVDAAQRADQAADDAAAAEVNAGNAQSEAEAAKQAAQQAEQEAQQAAQEAADAQEAANQSQSAAEAALSDAQAAQQAAEDALDQANQAAQEAGDSSAAAFAAQEAAQQAQSASDAAQAAAEAAEQQALEAEQRAISRGANLITNGTAHLGDNTNFSQFEYDPTDSPAGARGSFDVTGSKTVTTDETIPVDLSNSYLFRYSAKQKNLALTNTRFYGFLSPVDTDGLPVQPTYYMSRPGTLTTLAQPLNPGDTVVHLNSVEHWINNAGSSAHWRRLIFWNYVDGSGKVWAPETYSRWVSGSNVYADGAINAADNTITLNVPWSGAEYEAGHPVSNGGQGANYMYLGTVNAVVPNQWTVFSGSTKPGAHDPKRVDGDGDLIPLGQNPSSATLLLPEGTAGVKVGWIIAYQGTGVPAGETSRQSLAAVTLMDASAMSEALAARAAADAAKAAADAAQAAAEAAHDLAGDAEDAAKNALSAATHNAKNLFSTSRASGTAPYGTLWFQTDASGRIIYQQQQTGGTPPDPTTGTGGTDGSTWVPRPIRNEVIDNLDAGKITSGYIDAARIQTLQLSVGGSRTIGDIVDEQDALAGTVQDWGWPSDLTYIDGGKIYTDSIKANAIDVNELMADSAMVGQITTGHLASLAVTAEKLAAGAVTASKLDITSTSGTGNRWTLTSAGFQAFRTSSASSRSMLLDSGSLRFFDPDGVETVTLNGANNFFMGEFRTVRPGGTRGVIINNTYEGNPGIWFTTDGGGGYSKPGAWLTDINTLRIQGGLTPANTRAPVEIFGGLWIYGEHEGHWVEISGNGGATFSRGINAAETSYFRNVHATNNFTGDNGLTIAGTSNLQVTRVNAAFFFHNPSTSTFAANLGIATNPLDRIYKLTSSRRAKLDIQDLPIEGNILDVTPRVWYDRTQVEEYADVLTAQYQEGEDFEPDEVQASALAPGTFQHVPGLVAEEVEDAGLSAFVSYDAEGRVDGLMYDRLWVTLIPVVKALASRVSALEAALEQET